MTIRKIRNFILLTLLLTAPSAWAETIKCTPIATLPTIITTQGVYCLTGNLTTNMISGNAIEIQTNNVTIDLNGWKLGGQAAGLGTYANGIYAYQRKNITIRNGTIRGFVYGILLSDVSPYATSQGHLIEDIRADNNTYTGISVRGRGSIVRRNQVMYSGGSSVYPSAYGIQLYGEGVKALNNDISRTSAFSFNNGYGLYLYKTNGAVVEGNRIVLVFSDLGPTYGLYIGNSNGVLVRDNSYNFAEYGIFYANSTGKYKDNLTSVVTTPFTGGTNAGGNN